MRLLYLGNGPFAIPALRTLAASEHEIARVVARPDRPQGKHQVIEPGPVAGVAKSLHLPLMQPESVNAPEVRQQLLSLAADLMIVADFGELLSPETLACTRLGGLNIHGSLLPKYRGAAPIVWAIYHGEKQSGVSIIQMTARLDAGGVLLQKALPIGENQTAGDLERELADLGARLVLEAIDGLTQGSLTPVEQDPSQASKAPRVRKGDGLIDWSRTAQQIHDQVRAFHPWPLAFTSLPGKTGKPLRAQILCTKTLSEQGEDNPATPGTVLATGMDGIVVATGRGKMRIEQLRPEGKNTMDAATFLRGHKLIPGSRLGE